MYIVYSVKVKEIKTGPITVNKPYKTPGSPREESKPKRVDSRTAVKYENYTIKEKIQRF